jgi:nicotinamidase-related amidase
MQALALIDMQRWMFRLPERAAQLPAVVPAINKLVADFEASGLPVFNVHVVHKADRSTWSRLMLKYDYPCMIEGTSDIEPVDGLAMPGSARDIRKRANSAFLGTDFEEQLRNLDVKNCFWPARLSTAVSDSRPPTRPSVASRWSSPRTPRPIATHAIAK